MTSPSSHCKASGRLVKTRRTPKGAGGPPGRRPLQQRQAASARRPECGRDAMEDAFLAALRENPADGLAWRAMADWLDEDGQADRAELLRASRRLLALPVMRRSKERAALE